MARFKRSRIGLHRRQIARWDCLSRPRRPDDHAQQPQGCHSVCSRREGVVTYPRPDRSGAIDALPVANGADRPPASGFVYRPSGVGRNCCRRRGAKTSTRVLRRVGELRHDHQDEDDEQQAPHWKQRRARSIPPQPMAHVVHANRNHATRRPPSG